jgi:hypothetical protein
MKSADPSDVTSVLDAVRPDEEVTEIEPVETPSLEEASAVADEEVVEATKSADVQSVDVPTPVSKEETMSQNEAATPEVVIVPETASEADVLKAMPAAIRKMLDESAAQAAEALRKAAASEQALIAEREARADEAAVIKAAQWSHLSIDPTVVGPALRRLSETDGTLANEVVKALDSANALLETNVVFTEVGTDTAVPADDAFSKMENLAKAAVASGLAPSFEAALMDVAQSNPDLYTAYLTEKGR